MPRKKSSQATDRVRGCQGRSGPRERTGNARGPAGSRPAGPRILRRRRLLALLVEGVLEPLRRGDLDHRLGGDLDGLARGRVAAHARLALLQLHGPKAAQRDLAGRLEALHDDFLDSGEHGLRLGLRDSGLVGNGGEELSLRHAHVEPSLGHRRETAAKPRRAGESWDPDIAFGSPSQLPTARFARKMGLILRYTLGEDQKATRNGPLRGA